MSGMQGTAYRAHDNRALGARGAVRNPWVAQGTPVKMKHAEPAPKPKAAPTTTKTPKPTKPKAEPKPKATTATTAKSATGTTPRVKPTKRSAGAAALNTAMRFSDETVHNDFAHARTRAELEVAWQRSMGSGALPVADGLSHSMDVEQARNIMSAAKYITDAMPWLRERLARIAPVDNAEVRHALAERSLPRGMTKGTLAYTTPRNMLLASQASARGSEDWVVLGKQFGSRAQWQAVHANSSVPYSQGRHLTTQQLMRGFTPDGSPFLASSRAPAGPVAHELGHVVYNSIAEGSNHAAALDLRAFSDPSINRAYWRDQPGRPASVLSQYAKQDPGEAFAESFAALIYGTPQQRSQPIVREVARIINLAHPGTFKLPGEKAPKTASATTAPKAPRSRKAAAKKVSATT